MSESDLFLEKAGRAFRSAERSLVDGDVDFAASRTYYAYFYVAQALLASRGLRFSRHGQVIAQYGRHFAKTEYLDPSFHRLLDRAFTIRQVADYATSLAIETEAVDELIREGRRFVEAARSYLDEAASSQESPAEPQV